MITGLVVVAAVLLASSAFALWRKRTDGRVQEYEVAVAAGRPGAEDGDPEVLRAEQLGQELGRQATLVQFSTAFCQPCRAAKVVLASVAAAADGVRHIEIDAESHLDLVREVGIMRTPTTLILDAEGRITARATGVPRKDQVLAAIGRTLPA
jgi:thiol-disulfide isomerase/thioredoxin